MSDASSAQSYGGFRCSECGTGEHLEACTQAIVTGKLLPDASIGAYVEESYTDQTILFEDSIQCTLHAGSRVEAFVDGRWTYAAPCPGPPAEFDERRPGAYKCDQGKLLYYSSITGRCPTCNGRGFVDLPVDEEVAVRG